MIQKDINLETDTNVSIQHDINDSSKYFVRLSIGGYMFFDTARTTAEGAMRVYENIIQRDIND